MKIKIEQGNKSSQDKIIRIWANGEIITLKDVLRILDIIFKSEDSNYPINKGYEGRAKFLKAIIDLALGIPLERVIKKCDLEKKNSIKLVGRFHEILERN